MRGLGCQTQSQYLLRTTSGELGPLLCPGLTITCTCPADGGPAERVVPGQGAGRHRSPECQQKRKWKKLLLNETRRLIMAFQDCFPTSLLLRFA